jgi:hypothetical protein
MIMLGRGRGGGGRGGGSGGGGRRGGGFVVIDHGGGPWWTVPEIVPVPVTTCPDGYPPVQAADGQLYCPVRRRFSTLLGGPIIAMVAK